MMNLSSVVLSALMMLDPVEARPFSIPSADGTMIHGQVDRPDQVAAGVVVMVAGTGAFDRDVRFSEQPDARPVFLGLSGRLTARGVTVVRYDKRGVRYGATGPDRLDAAEIVTATTEAQRQDLAAVYNWVRTDEGLGGRCVVLFGHSEGMVHIGRLAASGVPAPTAVVGMGALLTDPVSNFRWNLAERDAYSLRLMDVNGDGVTTNEEVRENFAVTPAVVNGSIEPYLHPSGGWGAADLAAINQAWGSAYPMMRDATLAMPDDAPWPSEEAPSGVWQWAKSWYVDTTPVAANLARWNTPVVVHLGDRDSQTHAPLQEAAGEAALGERLTVRLHGAVGHTLGAHPTYGPLNEDLAEQISDDVAAALRGCAAPG